MFKHAKLKSALVMLLATIFTFLILTPAAEAAGKPGGTTTNSAPVITQGTEYSLTISEGITGKVTLKATDANRESMSWRVSTLASNGTATTSSVTNNKGTSTVTVQYVPNQNYIGIDSFVVTVKDTYGLEDSIQITVKVNPIPFATTINYVALGDSLATGTIYPGKTITSYVTFFHQFLQSQNPNATVTKTSFATDGDRTNELAAKLGLITDSMVAKDSNLISAVTSAHVITISIGGNNLMRAAKDDNALGGYNFNKIDTGIADQGLFDFQSQFIPIITEIKRLNPKAQIIVITMYNPYNETDASLHSIVDSYLFRDGQGINDIISTNANIIGYKVADVYKAFNDKYRNNMGAITYFYPTDFWGNLTRNPHPNATGQDIITTLHKTLYQSITN